MESPRRCWFVAPLLKWWHLNKRDYPWRKEGDVYRLLVAEIMLQRTRRDLVAKVYGKFIERFPSAETLAETDIEEAEELIRPLGLVKRARYLVALARELVNGKSLEELTGVGEYTATAIRVLRGEDVKLVADASIARILSRITGLPLRSDRPARTPWVNELLNSCAPSNKRDYLLALIDLAWEVCKPRRPLCPRCPLEKGCAYGRKRS